MPVHVAALLHVNVEVTDVDRARQFYLRFGFEEIRRQGTPGRPGAWLRFPSGAELHLSLGPRKPDSRAHFAILVDDLAAARQMAVDAGAPIETEREIPGQRRFFTRDPDGNRIEVVQRC
jgi:catechol 2,3-dioxygenase-like lactoylglutathione lyase family enzyme